MLKQGNIQAWFGRSNIRKYLILPTFKRFSFIFHECFKRSYNWIGTCKLEYIYTLKIADYLKKQYFCVCYSFFEKCAPRIRRHIECCLQSVRVKLDKTTTIAGCFSTTLDIWHFRNVTVNTSNFAIVWSFRFYIRSECFPASAK